MSEFIDPEHVLFVAKWTKTKATFAREVGIDPDPARVANFMKVFGINSLPFKPQDHTKQEQQA